MNSELFLACFLLYVVGVIGFGWWLSRRRQTGEEFLLGGRAVPLFLTLGTTIATMVGTGSSMGAVGKAYTHGWAGALYGIGGAAGILIAAWLFAPVRKYRFVTMAEEISSYVGANRSVANLVAVFTYLSSVGWLGAHILGGGKYLVYVTGIDPLLAKSLIACGFSIYAVIGGYRAVIWTDTLQAIVLFAGFTLTAWFSLQFAGGWEGLSKAQQSLSSTASPVPILSLFSIAIVIAVGVLGTPSFRQRIYSGDSTTAVRKAFAISGLLYLAFSLLPAIIGLTACNTNPELSDPDQAFPWMATQLLPVAIGIIVLIAGLSATMSSASSDAVSGVTTVIRDLHQLAFKRLPPPEKVVRCSRVSLTATTLLALGMALISDQIISYIASMISFFITGMCVAGILGRTWDRYNAPGAVASLIGASATAGAFQLNAFLSPDNNWNDIWGNPVIPSLVVATLLGVVVSLLTPDDPCSHEEAVARLAKEREGMENPAD